MQKGEKGSLADQLRLKLGLPEEYTPQIEDSTYTTKEEEQQYNTKGKIIVLLEKKGRAGKQVTIVRGFESSEEQIEGIGKQIKTQCGVGGAVKDGEIIIQGDKRDKIVQILTNMGFNAKRGN